ncbi:PHB depolymerase family esterase [soil metagenome]
MKSMLDPLMQKMLAEATRLTHTGKLGEATAAIQRALAGAAHGGASSSAPPSSPFSSPGSPGLSSLFDVPAAAPASPAGGEIIDGCVREVHDATAASRAPRAPDASSQAGEPASPAAGGHPGAHPANEASTARFEAGSFTAPSGTRQYKLFVPAGFAGQRLPLIVMLHGCTQNPDDFAAGTRMNELAQTQGALVLYPAQAPRSNVSKCWNWFQPADQKRGQGEPALLAAMTRQVIATHAVDPDRVFVAGLSAGGAMAAILAQEYPDLYAAAGVHSGLAAGAAHDMPSAFSAMQGGPAGTVKRAPRNERLGEAPVIVFHGDQDTTVNSRNGDRVIEQSADGATAERESGRTGRAYERTVYRQRDGSVRAEHWLIHGAGHAWSGGSASGSYTDSSGPDASAEMLRFFLAHPRGAATGSA